MPPTRKNSVDLPAASEMMIKSTPGLALHRRGRGRPRKNLVVDLSIDPEMMIKSTSGYVMCQNGGGKDIEMVLPIAPEMVTKSTPGTTAEATAHTPASGEQTSMDSQHQDTPEQALDMVARTLVSINQSRVGEERASLIKLVRDCGVTNFNSSTDPANAEEWIGKLEKFFNAVVCSDEQKLFLAIYLIEGNANYWWRDVERLYPDPSTITWNDFKREFKDKYVPLFYRDAKMKEFLMLVQGSMTVREYEEKFCSLSKYAPTLVADESDMCRRFENGLRRDIKMIVTAVGWTKFRGLVDAAIRVELCLLEDQGEGEKQQLNSSRAQRG